MYDCSFAEAPFGPAACGPAACGAEASASTELSVGQGDVEAELVLPQ